MIDVSREGCVAIVRYDRGEKANALNMKAIEALSDAARQLRRDDAISVVVLTGTAKRFSAGVDLNDGDLWMPWAGDVTRHRAMSAGGDMCSLWADLPQVTIAAIEGAAVGGGGILALAADFRVMADDAFFLFPEIRLGMMFGWGGLPLLASLVGPTVAKRLLFTGTRIEAGEARDIGLCEQIVPHGGALERAREMAAIIAECPPLALRMTKRNINMQLRSNWAAGFEADQFLLSRPANAGVG